MKERLEYAGLAFQTTSLCVGILYVTGFYINSLFTSNFGIFRTELLRLDYIKVGFVFNLITLGIVFVPIGIVLLSFSVRSSSNLPNFYLGIIGNSLNTILFFGVPIFFAFFATSVEWNLAFVEPLYIFTTVESAVVTFLVITFFGMAVIPALERLLYGTNFFAALL